MRAVAGRLQAFADRRGAPILPDDRTPGRCQGLSVPQDGGLALVGDADGVHLRVGGRVQGSLRSALRGLPDLLGGVLESPWAWEVLGELGIAASQDLGGRGDQHHCDAGGSCIDGEDHPGPFAPRPPRQDDSRDRLEYAGVDPVRGHLHFEVGLAGPVLRTIVDVCVDLSGSGQVPAHFIGQASFQR